MTSGVGLKILTGGDLFESGCSTLVNAVNCHGVMGAGIALEFKRRYPAMFVDYRHRCRRGEVRLGRPYLWRPEDGVGPSVLNFPTKDHWRDPSHLEAIADGLIWLRSHIVSGASPRWPSRRSAVAMAACAGRRSARYWPERSRS